VSGSGGEPAWYARRAALVVGVAAFLLYLPALGGAYVLDDGRAILGHPAVNGAAPWWEVFTREFWGADLSSIDWSSSYRPLTSLTFALEHRLTPEPWLHHLSNALFYGILCAQVTWLARRCARPAVALAVGLVFAVLPIHVENVASIVGRADVLASIAGLAAFAVAVRADGAPAGVARAALAAVLYAAALLCKETVALLPAVVGWFALLSLRRDGRWSHLVPALTLAAVGALYLALRHQVLSVALPPDFVPADNQLVERDGFLRLWGDLAVLGHYAELTLVPIRLCADHTYGDVFAPTSLAGAGALWAWIGLPLLVAMVVDGARALRGRSGGLWFAALIAYLLVGHWVIPLSVIVAERLAVWPGVWLALALAACCEGWTDRLRGRRAVLLVGLLVGVSAARSVHRSLDWSDALSLERSSAESCPAALHGRVLLAAEESRAGWHEEALWDYAVALAGRAAYPAPFESLLLDAEQDTPLAERLRTLPELMGARDRGRGWAALRGALLRLGARDEAALAEKLASGPP
jgi:hypothetical protein